MKSIQMAVINVCLGGAILLNMHCPCKPHLSCHSKEFLAAIAIALLAFLTGGILENHFPELPENDAP